MGDWTNGIFGCFGNFGICIVTYFVPCLTAGKNAEFVGKSCLVWGCLSICGPIGIYTRAVVRGEIREAKGIEGSFLMDCVCHWLCGACALCQEAQEIEGSAPAQQAAQAQSMARY